MLTLAFVHGLKLTEQQGSGASACGCLFLLDLASTSKILTFPVEYQGWGCLPVSIILQVILLPWIYETLNGSEMYNV